MKRARLVGILMMVMLANSPQTMAKAEYWKPKCEDGAKLEQRKGKPAFRCAREGGLVEEFRIGRCDRNQKLRRVNRYGYNYGCLGTAAMRQGGAGTSESYDMFECRPGYEKVSEATSPSRTCVRMVPGTAYEKPAF